MDNETRLQAGMKASFAVPDSYRHENQIRNFVVTESSNPTRMGLMYYDNDCSCKDFFVKFENIPASELSPTVADLRYMLVLYYGDAFDGETLTVTPQE